MTVTKIVLGGDEDPTTVHDYLATDHGVSFSTEDPEALDFLALMLECGKPFSITVDGRYLFVVAQSVDGPHIELAFETSTQAKLALNSH